MADERAWQTLGQRILYDAYPWVRLSVEHVRLPTGYEIPDFYRVEIAPYIMVFAQNPQGQVICLEHYKHGPGLVSLELPAGYIDEGETPLQAAQRELREEAGWSSDHWEGLGQYFVDGNRGCGWMHAFLARNCQTGGEQTLGSSELFTIHLKSLDELYALWINGQITNIAAATIIGRALVALAYLKAVP